MSKHDAVSEDTGSEEKGHTQSLKLVWAMLCKTSKSDDVYETKRDEDQHGGNDTSVIAEHELQTRQQGAVQYHYQPYRAQARKATQGDRVETHDRPEGVSSGARGRRTSSADTPLFCSHTYSPT